MVAGSSVMPGFAQEAFYVSDSSESSVEQITESITMALEEAAETSSMTALETASEITSAEQTPDAASAETEPAATSAETEPAATSAETEPAATSAETAPAATSAETAPAATSAETAPAATSAETAPVTTSAETVPEETPATTAETTSAETASSSEAETEAAPFVSTMTSASVWAGGDEEASQMSMYAPVMLALEDEEVTDKQVSANQLVATMLSKLGCGYSQPNRYAEYYYDCSSLVQRSMKELGITQNVPQTTYDWDLHCRDMEVGDSIYFSGEGGILAYKLTARNTTILENPEAFVIPGTITIYIEPGRSSGHAAVSLGSFPRVTNGLDPAKEGVAIVNATKNSVIELLAANYGVSLDLLNGSNRFSGNPNVWLDSNHIGEDIQIGVNKFSGSYNPIYRVEALNTSVGVCVNNLTTGTHGYNVRYVLTPTTLPAAPSIVETNVTEVTADGYRVEVVFDAPAGIRQVQMPTWTKTNEQDDIIWHEAEINGTRASYYVSVAEHNNEIDTYFTHVYVTDSAGREVVKELAVKLYQDEETPSEEPSTEAPSEEPSTEAPSVEPSTEAPSEEPSTEAPSEEPSTEPSEEETTAPSEEEEKLAIKSIAVSDESTKGYRVTVTFTAPAGVKEVEMPSWSKANGQDDLIWHKAQVSGNTATFFVPVATHNNEKGEYITHVYVRDKAGQFALEGVEATVPSTDEPMVPPVTSLLEIKSVSASNVSSDGYEVTVEFSAPAGVKEVVMPTWTKNEGQDDLIWHKADVSGNKATFYVPTSAHTYASGTYITHVYVRDLAGKEVLEGIEVSVPEKMNDEVIGFGDIETSEVTAAGFKITIPFLASHGVSSIKVPVWTEKDGQDDLVWHETQINGNIATAYIPTSAHKNELGNYVIHIYMYGNKGTTKFFDFTIEVKGDTVYPDDELAIHDVTISNASNDGYQVTAAFSAPAGVKEVLMPTWTKKNGQDDVVWHKATVSGNTATFYVSAADHNNEKGEYITHVYVYDNNGNKVLKEVTCNTANYVSIGGDFYMRSAGPAYITSQGYFVHVEMYAKYGIREILYPTWTEKDGQDDLIWYRGEMTEKKDNIYFASLYVPTADHNRETGTYYTHLYITDNTGKQQYRDFTITVPESEGTTTPSDPSDASLLEILSMTTSEVTASGYRVTVTFDSRASVKEVEMPTWTTADGQDDLIWHKAQIEGNTATFYVPVSQHGDASGEYTTHVYVRDQSGNEVHDGFTVDVPAAQQTAPSTPSTPSVPSGTGDPVIHSVKYSELSVSGYRVTVEFSAPAGVKEVEMPTWTRANEQDDLVWHKATVSGNTATFYVPISSHRNESGLYLTHVYVRDNNGKSALDFVEVTVPSGSGSTTTIPSVPSGISPKPQTDGNVAITSIVTKDSSANGYWVIATFNGIVNEVRMPSWSLANEKDDLIWHQATVNGNTAYCYIPAAEHGYQTGFYQTHVYVYGVNGQLEIKNIYAKVQ